MQHIVSHCLLCNVLSVQYKKDENNLELLLFEGEIKINIFKYVETPLDYP